MTFIGTTIDEYLHEEGVLEETKMIAVKRVISDALASFMNTKGLNVGHVANRFDVSPDDIRRALDPDDLSQEKKPLSLIACGLGLAYLPVN